MNNQNEKNNFEPNFSTDIQVNKAFGNKKIIALVVTLVIALTIGVTAFAASAKITNFYQSHFTSPDSYYRTVENHNFKNTKDSFLKSYKRDYEIVTSDSFGSSNTLKVNIDDSVSSMLSNEFLDLSALKSATIFFDGGVNNKALSYKMTGQINETDLISFNAFIDYGNAEMYAQIPQISDSYLNFSTLLATDEFKEASNSLKSLFDGSLYPEPEKIDRLLTTYSDLIINSVKNVTKKSTTLEAKGVKKKCTALTVKLSGEEVYNLLVSILDTASTDENTKSIVTGFTDIINYDDFTSEIKDMKASLEESKSEFETLENPLIMVVYVDSNGNIIGRDISLIDNEETVSFQYKTVVHGSKFGFELDVKENDDVIINIEGTGKASLTNLSGDFVVSLPDNNTFHVNIDKCNVSKLSDNVFEGDITITSDIITLAGYSIKLSFNSQPKEGSLNIDILSGDKIMGSATLTSKITDQVESVKPSADATLIDANDEIALLTYISDFDIETYVNDFAAKSGLNIRYEQLATLFLGASYGGSDEDFDFDSYDDEDFDDWDFDDYNDEDLSDLDLNDYGIDGL